MTSIHTQSRDQSWQKLQAISGLLFGLFIVVHLGNTALALAGPEVYNGVQAVLRSVYQHPVVEIGLLAVVLPLHITAGIVRMRIRAASAAAVALTPVQRVHRYAGWFLLVFIYGHAAAVRLPALIYDARPEFVGISFSLNFMPAWFYPYYFLLAAAGLYHALAGSRMALPRLGFRVRPLTRTQAKLTMSIASVLITLSLLAFGGALFDVGDPFESAYAKVYLDFLASFSQ